MKYFSSPSSLAIVSVTALEQIHHPSLDTHTHLGTVCPSFSLALQSSSPFLHVTFMVSFLKHKFDQVALLFKIFPHNQAPNECQRDIYGLFPSLGTAPISLRMNALCNILSLYKVLSSSSSTVLLISCVAGNECCLFCKGFLTSPS